MTGGWQRIPERGQLVYWMLKAMDGYVAITRSASICGQWRYTWHHTKGCDPPYEGLSCGYAGTVAAAKRGAEEFLLRAERSIKGF